MLSLHYLPNTLPRFTISSWCLRQPTRTTRSRSSSWRGLLPQSSDGSSSSLTQRSWEIRTPSQLLHRMRQLLGDKANTADPSFLWGLFLQRLPPNVKMVLASTSEREDLEAFASLADRVATPTVSKIETSHLSAEVEQQIADLRSLVKSLSSHPPSTSPKRGRSPRHQTPSPAPPTCPTGLCWYHMRFAERATKCNQPCSWDLGNKQASHWWRPVPPANPAVAYYLFMSDCRIVVF